jgi:hypothetical protein
LGIDFTASNVRITGASAFNQTIEIGSDETSLAQFRAFPAQFRTEWELNLEVDTCASDVAAQIRISGQSQSGESNHGEKLHFDVRYLMFL